MTDKEIARVLRGKYRKGPRFSDSPRYKRKAKLKLRYKGERLDREIERTAQKLTMLYQIRGKK